MSQQLACTYAALILSESGKFDADTLIAVTKAANVPVTKGMASAFASLLKTSDISKILSSANFAGSASAPAATTAAKKDAPVAEKKKEKEPEPEEEDDFGMGGLF